MGTAVYRLGVTLTELEEKFPTIRWSTPLRVDVPGGSGLACRICVANNGIKGADVGRLPQTREDFDRHMAEVHGLTAAKPE